MPITKRELYRSSNGDKWFLARESETGSLIVRHEANAPSGGQVTDVDIATFLAAGERHPEHDALLRLLGTLVDNAPRRRAKKSPDRPWGWRKWG